MRRKTMFKAGGAICAAALLTTSAAFAAGGFTDVPDDRFFSDPVQWAVDNEITTGCGDGTTFCPNDNVTRGQAATFLWRLFDSPASSFELTFDDVEEEALTRSAERRGRGQR